MEYLFLQLINGLCQGAIYALMAVGYSTVVGVTGMVSFTYGEVLMLGAFASFYAFDLFGANLLVAIPVSFLAAALVGVGIYKLCYERFFKANRNISMMCTVGFSMIAKNLAQIVFGAEQKPLLNVINNRVFTIGVVQISLIQIMILVIVIVLSALLAVCFNKTRWGVSLRAVNQDKDAAYMVGINVRKTAMLGNCLGCGLGGVAGILLAIYYQSLVATMGSSYGIKAFLSAVLGGLTDVGMAAVGGFCIGVIENIGITFSSANFRDAFAFLFLLIVLLIRPQGFVKKKGARP